MQPDDKRRGFPDTDLPADGVDTIPRAALLARERHGDREALVDDARRLTFVDYVDGAAAIARSLVAAGVCVGERVAVWAPNSIDLAVAILGVHTAGAVLVPINTRFKRNEAAFVLRQSRAKVVFTVDTFLGREYAEVVEAIYSGEQDAPRIVSFDATGDRSLQGFLDSGVGVSAAELEDLMLSVRPDDIGTILFTSGTTGRPKGAMLRHGALVRAYWTWSGAAGMRAGDRLLCTNPFFHAFGLKVGLLSALLRGVTIYPVAVFDAERALEVIERERISYYPGPPPVFQEILASPDFARRDIGSLRASVIGATALPPTLIRDMYDRLGFEEIHSPYGFTEGTGVATITIASDPPETVMTTAGIALPGVDVRIVRADGTPAAPSETGEIVVDGYNRMAGYLDPDSGQAVPDDGGPLYSGDLGALDEQGYLTVRGRLKDMYITGGFNVYPAEVEACIQEMPAVLAAAVLGMPDERLGEVGCAFVVRQSGQALVEQDVVGWCKQELANFKVPRAVVFLEGLPLNATGKVAKADLASLLPVRTDSSTSSR